MRRNRRSSRFSEGTRSGDVEKSDTDMEALIYMVHSDQCTLDGVRLVLARLKWEFVPQVKDWAQASALDKKRAEDATSSLYLIPNIWRIIDAGVDWKEAAVEEILESVGGICRWVAFCLPLGFTITTAAAKRSKTLTADTSLLYSTVLVNLMVLDPRIRTLFLNTPQFLESVVWIWTAEDEAGVPVMELEADVCRGTQLIQRVLLEEEGVESLVQYLLVKGRREHAATRFMKSAVRRMRYASKASPYKLGVDILSNTLGILYELLKSSEGSQIWFVLLRSQFITETTCAILNLYDRAGGDAHLLLLPMMFVVTIIQAQRYRTVHNLPKLLSSTELCAALLGAISRIPPHDYTTAGYARGILTFVSVYATYPAVYACAALIETVGNRNDCIPRLQILHEGPLKQAWSAFSTRIQYRKYLRNTKTPILCDNQMCIRWQSRFDLTLNPSAPRQCSGCSSVVYCSEECQRDDWIGLHCRECPSAAAFYARTKTLESWYSHRARALHQILAAGLFNGNEAMFERARPIHLPGHNAQEAMLQFDESQGLLPVKTSIIPLHDTEGWWGIANTETPQTWLWPRLSRLIEDCRTGRLPPDTRLVQVLLPIGKGVLIVMVAMLRMVEGRYKGVYNVARFIRSTLLSSPRVP
ncbi:hypothetical protein D9611_006003 [Ephemerocybe angulata]|uniref:MYND-type domain-containing protein n=1 Tax=Ephemerocybe angulata TaxID=980116 RepID=A0A8H5CIE3_9AGAR|nr:hypothetical protein D9611_006003 [Tulosesus angulatus]